MKLLAYTSNLGNFKEEYMSVSVVSTTWSSQNPAHRFTVYNPSTGKPYAEIQGCGAQEVDACVCAANKAFNETWRWLMPQERGKLLKKAARALQEYAEEIARIETEEVGKPLHISIADTRRCIEAFDFFGGLIGNLPTDLYELGPINALVFAEPFGVVAGIIPFNWPPLHTGAKVAPALAAGNTVVIKPGDQAPLSIMKIVEIAKTVLPPNVLDIVAGPGLETGQALTGHPLVRRVSFTGSDNSGRAVLKQVADNLTPCIMELGGKNVFIALSDCNVDKAVSLAYEGAFYNNGEACTATSRILVHRSQYKEFIDKMSEMVKRTYLGDGMDTKTHIGPMVTKQHMEKVLGYIKIGLQEGAVIAARGNLPTNPDFKDGYFVAPVLFAEVNRNMRIAREEIFGPVVCVIPYDNDEEAVSIANDTSFGLIAVIFTEDQTRAMRITRQLDTGCVYINNFYRLGPQCVPFGGNKASGFGRERSYDTLLEFSRPKAVRIPSGLGEIPTWSPD
ncbi:MAG: aldehyde dehydrogenase family protein [Treponema sp.]|jgi:acyl-CoA reductase-like NAD-dependent aldehyde dehydrogenase|nr:aldehyde dehydrogenase family protein [Treponema sp.]